MSDLMGKDYSIGDVLDLSGKRRFQEIELRTRVEPDATFTLDEMRFVISALKPIKQALEQIGKHKVIQLEDTGVGTEPMDKLREHDEQLATDFLYGTHEKPTIAQVMVLIRDVRQAALRQQTPAVGERLDLRKIESLLFNCAQILDVVKQEWSAEDSWSSWDQFVRDEITETQRTLLSVSQTPLRQQTPAVLAT